jgi:hypothetical protein
MGKSFLVLFFKKELLFQRMIHASVDLLSGLIELDKQRIRRRGM